IAMWNACALGSTYVFSVSMDNALRLTANRTATLNETGLFYFWSDYGSTIVSPYAKRSLMSITGGFSVGAAVQGGFVFGNLIGGNDDISWTAGEHQLGFGVGAGRCNNINQ